MTRVIWNAEGQRRFETGVDRGVLYVGTNAGVPWNGLVSISESPSGGEAKPLYLDGIKYANKAGREEFEATIEAYTYPPEFGQCDGTALVVNGLYATQQKRKSFGFSYRSKIGNDTDGIDYGYKIHLVYNALATPTSQNHATLGDNLEADNFSWKVTTRASVFGRAKPTSHFIIDSVKTPDSLLKEIESILYGDNNKTPRLPSIDELVYIFTSYGSSFFDAGLIGETYYKTFDGDKTGTFQTLLINAGALGVEVAYGQVNPGTTPSFYDGGGSVAMQTETFDGGSVSAVPTAIYDGGNA